MTSELNRVLDSSGHALTGLTTRQSAVDALTMHHMSDMENDVIPFYSLGDQLFVEPQPSALPAEIELDRPIPMSRPEIAVALSHIAVWRTIASGEHPYALVLEDDVWFRAAFARHLDNAWKEIHSNKTFVDQFDLLYLSYSEAKHGAPKTTFSDTLFRPLRGLWYMSGYVLSRRGASRLLDRLPCSGPIDLWINHQFRDLVVLATKWPVVNQRRDYVSTNSYSILPVLTKIGVLDASGESVFRRRPTEGPVFAFGPEKSGLSSLAMALSMLGYRCCSDVDHLEQNELRTLLLGANRRIFDAYVNIGSLVDKIPQLQKAFPNAKFIFTASGANDSMCNGRQVDVEMLGEKGVTLSVNDSNKWKIICEHLRCPPPPASFPRIVDQGQNRVLSHRDSSPNGINVRRSTWDRSPWIIEQHHRWHGIRCDPSACKAVTDRLRVQFTDSFKTLDGDVWELRDDTFGGNLGLFRPGNIRYVKEMGAEISVKQESLGVRDFSAGAISSKRRFHFGKFEVLMKVPAVPGIVSGFFLHRDTPRQEIDIEIVGNRSDHVLINVFYNPGDEGASFDYGYRGTPVLIKLGFDASKAFHRFAIEWLPSEIRWLVDGKLVHSRSNWDPTPIPHLPMVLHVNTWPTRSRELAGRLDNKRLPTAALVRSISVDASVDER